MAKDYIEDLPYPWDPNFHKVFVQEIGKLGFNEQEYKVIDFLESQYKITLVTESEEKRREVMSLMRQAKTKDQKLELFRQLGLEDIYYILLNMSPAEFIAVRRTWVESNSTLLKKLLDDIHKEPTEKPESTAKLQ